jgi:hypothetical protein
MSFHTSAGLGTRIRSAAALLRDLKCRGMLDHTPVVFCTEFGRMPMFQKGATGRDHNPLGLDHTRLRYYHNGIERRLTDVHGEVIKDNLA